MKTTYHVSRDGFAGAIADVLPPELNGGRFHMITRINVMEQYRGQGLGREVLALVLADADAEGVTLALEPVPYGPLDRDALEAWYGRHGFTWGDWYMIRRPIPLTQSNQKETIQ